jgi:hypothetical protein
VLLRVGKCAGRGCCVSDIHEATYASSYISRPGSPESVPYLDMLFLSALLLDYSAHGRKFLAAQWPHDFTHPL